MESHDRLLVVSPHLDDAVLSCGLLLAAHPAAVVCTVCTAPPRQNMSTDWDRRSGFADAFEAISERKAEDLKALTQLDAHLIHLPFCDVQYRQSPSHDSLVAAFGQTFRTIGPTIVLIPMGLFHSDHTLVAAACLALLQRVGEAEMYAYEDVPYRHMPGVVQTRLAELSKSGNVAKAAKLVRAAVDPRYEQMKQAAIGAYQSQLRAFGPDGQTGLVSAERYWQLSR